MSSQRSTRQSNKKLQYGDVSPKLSLKQKVSIEEQQQANLRQKQSSSKKESLSLTMSDQKPKKSSLMTKMSITTQNFVICKVGSFDDDYMVVGKIGEGSFGSVYKVYHKTLKVFRALKTIKKNPQSKFSVFQEIEILKKLDHSNILKIYEFYQAKQSLYIVTQFFEGRELFDEILENDKLSEEIAVQILVEVLIALNYIHNQGIAHRDIKAENILLKKGENGKFKVKIIDWGLGTLLDQEQQKNRVCGTPQYCAPEVLVGKYSISCDMWSLGVLVYIMLTGDMPFSGKNTQQTIQRVKKASFDIKDRKFRKLSNQAQTFISSLIVKEPTKRLTAQKCLQHPWIKLHYQKHNQKAPEHLKQTLQRLRQFKVTNCFGIAVVSYVNNHLSSQQQRQKLSQIFKFLDKNGDGVLSMPQLVQGYSQIYGKSMAQQIAKQTFQKLDINQNGSLQFSEFVAFGLQRQKQQQRAKLQQAFNLFDRNKDGSISMKQIKQILVGKFEGSGLLTEEDIKNIINQIDQNGDNEIDFQEFVKCVNEIYEKVSGKKEEKKQGNGKQENRKSKNNNGNTNGNQNSNSSASKRKYNNK